MTLFITRILLFLIILLIILFGFVFIMQNDFSRKFESFVPDDSIHTIIAGASYSAENINASLLKRTVNIAVDGEPLALSYLKTEYFLKKSKNIKTVVIGLSPSYLSLNRKSAKDNLKKNPESLTFIWYYNHNLVNYLSFSGMADLLEYIRTLPAAYRHLNKIRDRNIMKLHLFTEKFMPRTSILNKSDFQKKIREHFTNNGKEWNSFYPENLRLIGNIAKMCHENEIRLIIFYPPIHRDFYNLIPQKFKDKFYNTIISNQKKYNFEFRDYHDLPLPDSLFYDHDHLNYYGRDIFTNKLKDHLERNQN